MVENILGNQQIHRIDVNFNVKTTNLDSFIGRTAHINLIIQESLFKIINSTIPELFDIRSVLSSKWVLFSNTVLFIIFVYCLFIKYKCLQLSKISKHVLILLRYWVILISRSIGDFIKPTCIQLVSQKWDPWGWYFPFVYHTPINSFKPFMILHRISILYKAIITSDTPILYLTSGFKSFLIKSFALRLKKAGN